MAKDKNTAEYSCTRVTSTMVINGSITSSDNLLIEGQVFGDVSTTADLTASNLIIGNVEAANMAFNTARIKGNINTDGALAIGDSTIIIGNLDAVALKVAGKIHGDVKAEESVLLTDSALVVGDIEAAVVTTQPGSRINGAIKTISTDSQLDIDTEFDLGDIPDPESDELYTVTAPEKPITRIINSFKSNNDEVQDIEVIDESDDEGGDF